MDGIPIYILIELVVFGFDILSTLISTWPRMPQFVEFWIYGTVLTHGQVLCGLRRFFFAAKQFQYVGLWAVKKVAHDVEKGLAPWKLSLD